MQFLDFDYKSILYTNPNPIFFIKKNKYFVDVNFINDKLPKMNNINTLDSVANELENIRNKDFNCLINI